MSLLKIDPRELNEDGLQQQARENTVPWQLATIAESIDSLRRDVRALQGATVFVANCLLLLALIFAIPPVVQLVRWLLVVIR